MDQATSKNKQIITTLAVLVFLAVIVGGAMAFTGNDETSPTTNTTSTTQTTSESSGSSMTSDHSDMDHADGEYTASADYATPGGVDTITLNVTLADNAVTAVSMSTNPQDGESKEYDDNFQEAYKEFVVGKPIDEIALSRIAGSSLTTGGFMDALDQIATQAHQ